MFLSCIFIFLIFYLCGMRTFDGTLVTNKQYISQRFLKFIVFRNVYAQWMFSLCYALGAREKVSKGYKASTFVKNRYPMGT